MSTYEGFTLRITAHCATCESPVPINGLYPQVRCRACGEDFDVRALWDAVFGPAEQAEALGFEPGSGQTGRLLSPIQASYAYGRRMPRCQDCKHELPEPERLRALAADGGMACPGCERRISLRTADAFGRQQIPGLSLLVNEGGDGRAPVEQQRKPVVFPCMTCGGGLEVDGSARRVTCRFCTADNYLPDALWREVNPVPRARVFFAIAEISASARLERMLESEEGAAQVARTLTAAQATPERLSRLLQHDDWEVRQALASNPAAPTATQSALASDQDSDVREALAKNPALTASAQATLLTDSGDDVREALAKNPAFTASLQEQLAKAERDFRVQRALAGRPDLSEAVMVALVRNPELDARVLPLLQQRASDSPEQLTTFHAEQADAARSRALEDDPVALIRGLEQEDLVEPLLSKLVQHRDRAARLALAQHPHAPPGALSALHNDDDSAVREAVAIHPALPAEAMEALAAHPRYDTRCALARHPSLPAGIQIQMARAEDDTDVQHALVGRADLAPDAIVAMAQRPSLYHEIGSLLAQHPAAPIAALEILARHHQPPVRAAAAQHPATPDALLLTLARDQDADVAAAAKGSARYPAVRRKHRRGRLLRAAVALGCLGILAGGALLVVLAYGIAQAGGVEPFLRSLGISI